MALDGIRLSDLYSTSDYNRWASDENNRQLVSYALEKNPNTSERTISGHFYLNSKIKEAIGEDGFRKLPKNMGLQEKLDWVNNNLSPDIFGSSTMEEPEIVQPQMVQKDSVTRPVPQSKVELEEEAVGAQIPFILPTKDPLTGKTRVEKTLRDWFRDNAGGNYAGFLESRRAQMEQQREEQWGSVKDFPNVDLTGVWGSGFKSGETKQLEDELSVLKETNPDNTFAIKLKENQLKASRERDYNKTQGAFKELEKEETLRSNIVGNRPQHFSPVNRSLWGNPETQQKVDELTEDLRRRLDEDPTFAYDTFKNFEDDMAKYVPKYKYYHDTWAMPFSPDEMKDIMAEYYSIRQIKDGNEAIDFAYSVFQNRLADNQSLYDKASVALLQDGANIMGYGTAAVGIYLNSLEGAKKAFSKADDIDGLGWWKEFLYYASDNDITRYGNNVVKTGKWNPEVQKQYAEDNVNALELFRRPGNETKFADVNTFFDVFAQSGFTVGGMMIGGGVANVLSRTVGRGASLLATNLLAKEGAGAVSRIVSKGIEILGKQLTTIGAAYLPAAAEASVDAEETYNISKNNAADIVLMGMEDQLRREYEDGTYEMWYQRNSRIPYELDAEHPLTKEQKEQLAQLRQQERAYLWDTYQNLRQEEVLSDPEVQKFIETGAKRAAARNLFDEATWIALGDYTISNALGKSFRAVKERSWRALFGEPRTKFKWVPEGNHYRPVVKEITFADKAKAIGRGVVEMAEEGFEEQFQTVDTQLRQDLNQHMIAQYIENRFDPESTAVVSDKVRKNWELVNKSLGENLLSEEAIFSFLMGAVSTGLGSPTVFRGVRTGIDARRKGASFGKALWQGARASIRNPFFENWEEMKTKKLEEQSEADDLNKWITAHKDDLDTLNDEVAIIKFIDQQAQAVKAGDEATYRDAVMGQKVATMLMMERVNPNGAKVNFYERIKQLAELKPSDPEARDVLEQALSYRGEEGITRTSEGPLSKEEAAIVEDVSKKAQDLLNTQKALKQEISILTNQFGNTISRETRDALAYSLIMQQDWTSRIASIQENAVRAYNEANPQTRVTPIPTEEQAPLNALARYGNKENIETEFKELLKRREAIRAGRKNMYRYEYKSELAKVQRQLKANRDAAKAFAKLEEGRVITAQEILSLSPTERAYLLDEANRKNYSEAQQREISIFSTSDGIRGDMITDLIDAGRLQAKKEFFKDEYDSLVENDKEIPLFDREIRKKASKTWTKAKLATAMEATTYDEFRDAMDKSLQTGEFTTMDRMSMSEIFNGKDVSKQTSEFYQRYKKEEMTRRAVRSIVENSPEFKSMGEEEKAVVSDAVEQVQREGKEVTSESILAKLFDPEYLAQLERQGIDITPIVQSAEQLAKAVEKAMAQKAVYDENVAGLKRAAEQRAEEGKQAKDPSQTPKADGKTKAEPETVISKNRYESLRAKLETVFGKLANNFTSRKQKPLTTDEYVTLMSLYTGEPIDGDILVDDLNTTIDEEGFSENIAKLKKAVEGKLYTDETAKDSQEVVNTLMLIATMEQMLGKVAQIRATGRHSNIQSFVKNTILQIRPDLKQSFVPKEKVLDEKKLTRLDSKAEAYLTTETEKKWYTDQNISENLRTLSKLDSSELRFVLIKDSALESQLQEELGEELDDDNLPVIIAARVPLKTPGAIQGKDGYTYLYVGLLTDSRAIPAAEERNQYNNARAILIEQEQDGPLIYKGKTLTTVLKIEKEQATKDKEETTSFKDFLLDKFSDIKDERARKEAALDDLKKHYRRVRVTVKDGVATAHYSWPKKKADGTIEEQPVTRTWSTTAPDDAKGRTQGAYIMEDPHTGVTKPLFLEVRAIDDVSFDSDHSIYQMLSDPKIDIVSSKYAYNEGNYVRKAIMAVRAMVRENKGLFTSRQGLASLNSTATSPGLFERTVARYFNLLKTAEYAKGEISLGVEIDGDLIKFTACQAGTENKEKKQVYGIPLVLGTMPLSVLKESDEEINRVVAETMKEVFKQLIFDSDGNIRTHDVRGRQWPVIKFEDNLSKNDPSVEKAFDEDDVALKFFGNVWQARTYAFDPIPTSVSVEPVALGPQGPIDPSTADPQQEAIRRITAPEFIDEHEGEHFELSSGEVEVTTFIKGGEDDVDWGLDSLIGKFATNLGTSIDKLYRVYRRTKNKSVEEIVSYMKEKGAGSWPGLRWTSEMVSMLEQFKRIDKFFADRGEVQVTADLIFRSEVVYGSKKKFLVGKPDIITVDKQGVYHIYDMKTFRYSGTTASQVPGFTSPSFTIRGKRNMDKDMDKWRKQLSMYKAMIESLLGPGTVSPVLGIIPIRLGYTPSGSIDTSPVPGIGAHKVYDASGKNMYLSFDDAPLEESPTGGKEPITRCYDQPIRLDAIEKLDDINPDGWKDVTAADEYSLKLGKLKGTRHRIEEKSDAGPDLLAGVEMPGKTGSAVEGTSMEVSADKSEQPLTDDYPDLGLYQGPEEVGVAESAQPEIAGPVFMRKPVEQRTAEEIQQELSGDASVFDGLEDLLNQNDCRNPAK